ncbi:uncharacterized protein PHACADRAFT_261479 [Phanerochaete carnosa HHB-10118-sp]|uniref:Uncharacterized protein n=1 Tax=Phanerochaete carnosa (strain HHB-10118-sp) TaxID=650164 RepID=K5VN26_PHACS|nr:uncharacterized protein PHACADRAFT_261479 [Phanerochaete carnosa HHB-10118-sp]EKM52828.1 hypothetical protein PHACADRAFT_261479 [Phanerochaete carnosa HHB-10118-sp]
MRVTQAPARQPETGASGKLFWLDSSGCVRSCCDGRTRGSACLPHVAISPRVIGSHERIFVLCAPLVGVCASRAS